MDLFTQDTFKKSSCNKNPDQGDPICNRENRGKLGNFTNFYYDTEEKQCKPFTYNGCGGNENNFQTQHECQITCDGEFIVHFFKVNFTTHFVIKIV